MQIVGYLFVNRGSDKRRLNVQQKLPTHLKKLFSERFPATHESLLGDMEGNVKALTELPMLSTQLAKLTAAPKKVTETGPKGGVGKKEGLVKKEEGRQAHRSLHLAGATQQEASSSAEAQQR